MDSRVLHTRAKFFYFTNRILHLYNFEYNSRERQLLPQTFHKFQRTCIWSLLLALVLFSMQEEFKKIFAALGFADYMRLVNTHYAQRATIDFLKDLVNYYTLVRLLSFLFLQKKGKCLRQLVNEFLLLRRRTIHLTSKDIGVNPHFRLLMVCENVLRLLLVFKHITDPSVSPVYDVLFEIFFCVYQTLQLAHLSLCRNLNNFLRAVIDGNHLKQCVGDCKPRKRTLHCVLVLCHQLRKLHTLFVLQFSWFTPLVYFQIVKCIYAMYLCIACIYVSSIEWTEKFSAVLIIYAPDMALPILHVSSIGTLNDDLDSELQTTLDYFAIVSVKLNNLKPCQKCVYMQRLWDLNILAQKMESITKPIFNDIQMNRVFAFNYIVTILLMSITCAQYVMEFPHAYRISVL